MPRTRETNRRISVRPLLILALCAGAAAALGVVPDKAVNPFPADGATGMTTNQLRWGKVTNATGYMVYFNTSETLRTNLNSNATTNYGTGALTPGTYTWRVNPTNGLNITTGDVWTFTAALPDKAANPTPANGALDVTNRSILYWGRVTNATGYYVYFNDGNFLRVTNGAAGTTNYSMGVLLPGTTYTWRVASTNSSIAGCTTGDVWSFTTMFPPGTPVNPTPADGAGNVCVGAMDTFSWPAATNAETYNFWLDGVKWATVSTTNYVPYVPSVGAHTWRVEAANSFAVSTGATWTFTTRSYATSAGQWYVAPDGDGTAGTNWATAFRSVGVSASVATNLGDAINIKTGTYAHLTAIVISNAPGVTIAGGYSGTTPEPGDRTDDPAATVITRDASVTNRIFFGVNSTATFDRVTISGGLLNPTNDVTTFRVDDAGSGMYMTNCRVAITNCTVANNVASCSAKQTVNNSTRWGAGLCLMNCATFLNGASFTNNVIQGGTVNLGYGGAIYASRGQLSLNGVSFLNNGVIGQRYDVGQGGAIYCGDVIFTASGCVFNANFTRDTMVLLAPGASMGGALYLNAGTATVSRCVFANNWSHDYQGQSASGRFQLGGAICASGVRPLTLASCRFAGNYVTTATALNPAYTKGGALYLENSAVSLVNCAIEGNGQSFTNLGDVYIASGTVAMTNTLIANNWGIAASSPTNAGGGIVVAAGTATVVNCTLAGSSGWGITPFTNGMPARLTVRNSIVWTNAVGGLNTNFSGAGNVAVAYSDLQDAWYAALDASNIGGDPAFVATNDFRLGRASCAIDAGTNEAWMAGATDLAGRPRKIGPKVDMGAYEAPLTPRGTAVFFW